MSVKAPILGGKGQAELSGDLFEEPFHHSLVWETSRADLAARRRGTASTLTRGEVAMTTAKAWRQKGTGRARAGALSVSQRTGGGITFGPKPRHYTLKVNRKARRRAFRSALSVHAARGSIAVIEPDFVSDPSTKQASAALADWGAKLPTLVVLDGEELNLLKSFRNLPRVNVIQASEASVADVIGSASLVVSRSALDHLARRGGTDGERS